MYKLPVQSPKKPEYGKKPLLYRLPFIFKIKFMNFPTKNTSQDDIALKNHSL